jgi:hypothetical protein
MMPSLMDSPCIPCVQKNSKVRVDGNQVYSSFPGSSFLHIIYLPTKDVEYFS